LNLKCLTWFCEQFLCYQTFFLTVCNADETGIETVNVTLFERL
jgi:hypothetical protein